jgi:hypothetical protein
MRYVVDTVDPMYLLIWLPILVYGIINHGYTVLLTWLLIAPVALNVFGNPGRNPFFYTPL